MPEAGAAETAAAASYEKTLRVVTRSAVDISDDDDDIAKRRRWMRIGGLLSGLTAITLGAAELRPLIWGTLLFVAIFLMRASAAPKKQRRPKLVGSDAFVRVNAEGVCASGAPLIPSSAIASAYYQPRWPKGRDSVCCADAEGNILFEAEVGGEKDAARFLRALGRDVNQRRVSFNTVSPFVSTSVRRFFSTLALLGFFIGATIGFHAIHYDTVWSMLLAAAASALPLMVGWSKGKVEVGVDGLLVKWPLIKYAGTPHFFSYGSIKSVIALNRREIMITLDSGKAFVITVPPEAFTSDELARQALLTRIEEARKKFESGDATKELTARVGRGSRDVKAWRASLNELRNGGGNYREAATRDEDLWRVVEDPSAPEDARAAAALLLRDNEDAKPRLRIAAEAVASPKLRIALETVADKDAADHVVDEALEPLRASEESLLDEEEEPEQKEQTA